VVETVREKIGEEPTVDGRVRTQEALQGNQSIVLNADHAASLFAATPELEFSDAQRALVEGERVRASVGVADGEIVAADFSSGTSVSRAATARDDLSYTVQGGTMALPHLEKSLLAITGNDPIHGALDPAAKWTVARAIASAIEGTGVSVSASKAESEQLAGGISGEAGGRLGAPGKALGPSGAIGVQGSYTGTVSDQSDTRVDGTVLEAERILHESRQSLAADLKRTAGAEWANTVTKEEFAKAWNERIESMTAESAARFRQHGERAWESHEPVRRGEDERNRAEVPPERKYSDKEIAYMGGQLP
jgi:hypothetical protein